ncbi:MAG: imidazole glycerol phosphate synthase subunit HisH [Thermoguttaceae bacterium]|nr:imidazole glycerol phosphate synthase subunit HisH [Thermoguttaceae bacterium]
MLAIIDYGMGNLRSVQKALEHVGVPACFTSDPKVVLDADHVVLPGVGAIAEAMLELERHHMIDAIHQIIEKGIPFIGICLGFQLLFDSSEENGLHPGLGLLKGKVRLFQLPREYAVPHMGWNQLTWPTDASGKKKISPLFQGLDEGTHVYFVHSYYAQPEDEAVVAAWTDYGRPFCSAVTQNNIYGTQFHPEKSQSVGLTILKNFSQIQTAVSGERQENL